MNYAMRFPPKAPITLITHCHATLTLTQRRVCTRTMNIF